MLGMPGRRRPSAIDLRYRGAVPGPDVDPAEPRVAVVLSRDAEIGSACAAELVSTHPGSIVVLVGAGTATDDVIHRPVEPHDPGRVAAAVQAVREDLGPVGVLVAVGHHPIPPAGPDEGVPPAAVLAEELLTVDAAVSSVTGDLAADGDGRIVLVGAVADVTRSGLAPAQAAAMWGLVGLMRSLAQSLGPSGVTVNVVRTGLIGTAAFSAVADEDRVAASLKLVVADTPLKRIGSVDEVAAAVGYLASPEASYLSGVVLPVDGGLTMGRTGA